MTITIYDETIFVVNKKFTAEVFFYIEYHFFFVILQIHIE